MANDIPMNSPDPFCQRITQEPHWAVVEMDRLNARRQELMFDDGTPKYLDSTYNMDELNKIMDNLLYLQDVLRLEPEPLRGEEGATEKSEPTTEHSTTDTR